MFDILAIACTVRCSGKVRSLVPESFLLWWGRLRESVGDQVCSSQTLLEDTPRYH
jgi:hypothetical protein